MKKLNLIQITAVFVLSLFFLIPISLYPENPDQVTKRLETIDKLINPELTWSISSKKEGPPGKFKPGDRVKHREFIIQATYKGLENFCGVKVLDTPLHLELLLYSKGLSEIEVWVGDERTDSFHVDGSSGTGAELEKTIIITSTYALQEYPVKFKIKNKGFKPFRTEYWPPRKKEPKEENSYFMIKEAAIAFPDAAEAHQKMKSWLLSMRNGYALLNPDFQRFTFIGQPFKIEDKRNTPKMRLKIMGRKLKRAVMTIDPALLNDNQPEKLAEVIKESYMLSRPVKRFAKNFKVYLVGNAHIDIAWLWRMSETVMVARNTYDTVLKNMEEYPELHYAQSQALTYQWMEKQYPDIFERIKQKVKEGRWEIVGGMWVEPDCNLISGESWVRQLLYGKRYFKEKFDLDVETGWNPDSFGYNWNMPQIYTKSGIKRFITQKIWWNDTTVFPHFIFWWQGVDDTRLLTYFPPVGYTARVKLPKDIVNITRYEATTGYKKTLLLYGLGDHGGGPNREILDRVRSYKGLHIAPKFIHSKSIDFLQNMSVDLKDEIPVWEDELYLEYHRGTYTTQAETKKNNRKSESYLSSAEKLAAAASMIDPANVYPQKELEQAWKTVLTNQFHDILPGSSITPVYHDAREDYKRAGKKIKKVIGTSLEKIAKSIDTSTVKGKPLMIFNPLSWTRWDVVSVKIPLPEDETVVLFDADGKDVPVEINRHCESPEASLCFIAKNIPALGYRVFSIVNKKMEQGKEEKKSEPAGETGDFLDMENKFYKLKINKKSGNIAGIFDKQLNREFVAEGKEANVLQVYEDLPEHWDAWNIGYTGRMWELNEAESVEMVEDSPVRQVVKVTKNFLGLSKNRYSPTEEFPSSFFTQYVILYKGLDRIDIKTEADWWEDHMLLKAAFPVNVKSDFATYEIPFASIKRTTKSETLWEKARFEVAALRWADLSDESGGISLLNDSKYGHDIHGGVMKISLLRAPTWPDPMADRGKHSFVYSIYTHKGGVTGSAVVKRGRELNAPLLPLLTDNHKGTLPLSFGFFEVRSGSVILDTVKKAEDDDGIILRLYESSGADGSAEIVFFKQPKTIHETDLMETPGQEHPANEKSLSLTFKKFEIKTLKVKF
jgi:alpha-mannosidase